MTKTKTVIIDDTLHYELCLLKLQLEKRSISDVMEMMLIKCFPEKKKEFENKK